MSGCQDYAAHAAMRAMQHPDPRLSSTDRCVLSFLVYRVFPGTTKCGRSVADMLQAMPHLKTRQTISASLNKLKALGEIDIKRRMRDTNHYTVLDPSGHIYGEPAWTFNPGPSPDVKESRHQANEPADVKETRHQEGSDVKNSRHVRCQEMPTSDVKNSRHQGGSDVGKTLHESDSQIEDSQEDSQSKIVVLRTTGAPVVAPAETPPPDIRKQVWDEGLPLLFRMTGQGRGPAGKEIGRLLKAANQNHAVVLAALRAAEEVQPSGDLMAWLMAAVHKRRERAPDPNRVYGAAAAALKLRREANALRENAQ
jgi:hypothetical protein